MQLRLVFTRGAPRGPYSQAIRKGKKLSTISRVVVHPKYHTISLGSKLKGNTTFSGDALRGNARRHGKIQSFCRKSGMRKIVEQPRPKEALTFAETLSKLGFNIHRLGSEKYVYNKLKTLKAKDIAHVREAFIKHCHARFMKYFSYHMPFGRKQNYVKEVHEASLERLHT